MGPLEFFEKAYSCYQESPRKEERKLLFLAGTTFCLSFKDEALQKVLLPALCHLNKEADRFDVEVCIWSGGDLQFPWSDRHYDLRGEVIQYNTDRIFAVKDIHTGVFCMLDKERNIALYWVKDLDNLPWWTSGSPLQLIIHWHMADKGYQLTHAAAVGNHTGGVVLSGKGGSGKSTTTLACMQEGLSYISEDYCLLNEQEVHSVYNSAKLSDATLERFPHLLPHVSNPERKNGDKAFLFHETFQPQKILKSAPLKALCTLQIDNSCYLEPIDPRVALQALSISTMWQLTHSGPSAFKRLEKISRRIPCYRLHVGSDFAAIADTIRTLL